MRYAVFSDVHANMIAWNAVRYDIGQRGVDVLVCLGDLVGYGPRPMEVLEGIRAATPNILMGNHDAAAVGLLDSSIFNDRAKHSTEWTAQALTDEARAFLADLPLAMESEGILFVHSEVCQPGRFGYINGPVEALANFLGGEHRVTFLGHTHYPKLFEWDGAGAVLEFPATSLVLDTAKRYIVNVGSVGEPRDANDLRARYIIYDTDRELLEFFAVEFDIPACRADLDRTDLGLTPYFLQVFEESLVDAEESLCEEAPASQLLQAAGKTSITKRLELSASIAHPARPRKKVSPRIGISKAKRSKGKGVNQVLVFFSLLLVMGGISWLLITRQRGSQTTAGLVEKGPSLVSAPEQPEESTPISLDPVVATPSPQIEPLEVIVSTPVPQVDSSLPEVIPAVPVVATNTDSGSSLKISVVSVGDKVPTLDHSYGTLELAYNFGYSGPEISQDGIKFQSVTHPPVAAPVYGTTHGITVKGTSGGASPEFSVADLGDDLWQTITYTDRRDDLRLEISGLDPGKSYQLQVLLGEPRNNKSTRYNNGLITVTDGNGASQSTRLTFGNNDGDYALLRIECAASNSLIFVMPKAGLGPEVAGIVIHSTVLPDR